MKFQSLFSGKNMTIFINSTSAESVKKVVMFNDITKLHSKLVYVT